MKAYVEKQLRSPVWVIDGRWRVNGEIASCGITAVLDSHLKYHKPRAGSFKQSVRYGTNLLFLRFFRAAISMIKRSSKALNFEAEVARLVVRFTGVREETANAFARSWRRRGDLSKRAALQIWNGAGIHLQIGSVVDRQLKELFRGKAATAEGLRPESIALLCHIGKHGLLPLDAGVKVTGYKLADGHCSRCGLEPSTPTFSTEVDLVAWNPANSTVELIEIKTYKGLTLDKYTLNKYRYQAWLSWIMFANTFPQLASFCRARLIVVSLVSRTVLSIPVAPRRITGKILKSFGCFDNWCRRRMALCAPVPTNAYRLPHRKSTPASRSRLKMPVGLRRSSNSCFRASK
ncbi:UNVERIFIED_CONTAM: hypothetical protein FKN15_003324 [Acipenser sinensis]